MLRLVLLWFCLLPSLALGAPQAQAFLDLGASIVPDDGVGGGAFAGVRATAGKGFHAGGGVGIDALRGFSHGRAQAFVHGAGLLGGTADPSSTLRVRFEALIGGGATRDAGSPGVNRGPISGRFQALARVTFLGYPGPQRRVGVGFFAAVGLGVGFAGADHWRMPHGRLGLTVELGPSHRVRGEGEDRIRDSMAELSP